MIKHNELIDLDAFVQDREEEIIEANGQQPLLDHIMDQQAKLLNHGINNVQQREVPLMMNSLICACLLQQRKWKLTFGELTKMTDFLFDYIKERQMMTYVSGRPSNFTIKETVVFLGGKVEGAPLDRKKGA